MWHCVVVQVVLNIMKALKSFEMQKNTFSRYCFCRFTSAGKWQSQWASGSWHTFLWEVLALEGSWHYSPSECWESLTQQQSNIIHNHLNLWSMTGFLNLKQAENHQEDKKATHMHTAPKSLLLIALFKLLYPQPWTKKCVVYQFVIMCTHNSNETQLWIYSSPKLIKLIIFTNWWCKFFFNGYFSCTSFFFTWLQKSQLPNLMITATINFKSLRMSPQK